MPNYCFDDTITLDEKGYLRCKECNTLLGDGTTNTYTDCISQNIYSTNSEGQLQLAEGHVHV